MNVKDYYKILGIEKTASESEIKQAYRRLAMKYHPDRNPGDLTSESKFKEINEAYECLGDKEKRQNYDNGIANGNPFANRGNNQHAFHQSFDFSEMFNNIFGQTTFNFGPNGRASRQQSVNVLTISLEDAYLGKSIKIDSNTSINIPQGVRPGTRFFYNNSLYTIDIKPHNKFKRSNDDLLVDIEINAVEAILGAEAVLEHIDNVKLQFNIPAGIQQGQVIKLSGKGIKNPEIDRYGDLLVRVSIKIPTNLSEESKNLLKSFEHRTVVKI